MPLVMDREEEGNISPIIQHGGVTFSFIKYNNLYLVSVTKKNANVAMVFQFLHKVVQVSLYNESSDSGMYEVYGSYPVQLDRNLPH